MKIFWVLKNAQINREPRERTWNFMFDDQYEQKPTKIR